MQAIDEIKFNDLGLIPVITQDYKTNEVLMMAWMNKDCLKISIEKKIATYYSRSRNKIWTKGEQSGNSQEIIDIYTDCDKDVILIKVKQIANIACHTGRKSCFFNELNNNKWSICQKVIKDPKKIYV